MKKSFIPQIALLIILALAACATAAEVSPSEVIKALHEALLTSMKSGEQRSCGQRFETLLPVVTSHFDFTFIARLAVGRYWQGLEETQKQALVTALSNMSAATYARNFDSFSGQRFDTVETRQTREDKAVVKTLLITDRDEKVDLDYICRRTDSGWKIVSVSARGVNDLSLKRAEYTSFLKNHDITELIVKIQKITEKCTNR